MNSIHLICTLEFLDIMYTLLPKMHILYVTSSPIPKNLVEYVTQKHIVLFGKLNDM